jgi:hypothetical protein
MSKSQHTTYPEIVTGDDVATLANKLMAEIAWRMDEEGLNASEIAYMRFDLMSTVATYLPDTFRQRRSA